MAKAKSVRRGAPKVSKGTIWSNLRWIHPQRTDYGTGVPALKEKLRYFTYRDDRDIKAPSGGRRWIDHGLGSTHGDILKNCQTLTSDDRLAWTMMISPKPRLMMLIEDEADRRALVENLTEEVIEQWFEARGFVEPTYSYVVHDRSTSEEGHQQLHSHVILPGTVQTIGGRERFDNNPNNLREFNTLVEDLFEVHMDRQLGMAWRQQWAAIQREEALRKYWQAMQWGDVPNELPDLAERMHAAGYTVERLPADVTNPNDLNHWLNNVEARGQDLDAWFGS